MTRVNEFTSYGKATNDAHSNFLNCFRFFICKYSWGYECAGTLPGIYSRLSYPPNYNFIREQICSNSDFPPDYLGCGKCSKCSVIPVWMDTTHLKSTFFHISTEMSISLFALQLLCRGNPDAHSIPYVLPYMVSYFRSD